MRVHVVRTAMIGGGLSYDVEVPVSDVPNYDGSRYTTIVREGKHYVDFVNATLPESHFAMPQGWDRYEAFKAHEKQAERIALDLAERVFPELAKYRAAGNDRLPMLWVNNLLPIETSDEYTIKATRPYTWDTAPA